MMNVYWLTRITAVLDFFDFLAVCSFIFLCVYSIAYIFVLEDGEVENVFFRFIKKTKKYIKFAIIAFIIPFVLGLFLPDREAIRLMILKETVIEDGVKVVHTID